MKAADQTRAKYLNMRSSLRLTMPEDEPLYLQVTLNTRIDLPVIELGGGGVRLLCYKYQQFFDDLNVGQSLGPSVLMLPEEGTYEVKPVVRWKKWPCIGVQFIDLSNADREHIFKVLFRVERKKLKQMKLEPQEKPRNRRAQLGLPQRFAR
jgi:c-di-GMP-binding flagellar brake protein YcgR